MYNKRKFNKINDKKVLHKVKKQWVTISLALLMMIGGGAVATHVNASANVANQNQQPVSVKLGSRNGKKNTITKKANALHRNLLSKANVNKSANNGARKQINTTHQGNLVTVNNKPAKKVNNINRVGMHKANLYHGYVYNRINKPFQNLRINRTVALHSSVGLSNDRILGYLQPGNSVKASRTFKQFGHYSNYLRYEINLSNKRTAFITGNNHFVSYIIPTRSYKYYQNKANKLVHNANSKNAKKISKQLRKLNNQRNHNFIKYANLYEMAFNAQQRAKYPVAVNYNNKQHNDVDNMSTNTNVTPMSNSATPAVSSAPSTPSYTYVPAMPSYVAPVSSASSVIMPSSSVAPKSSSASAKSMSSGANSSAVSSMSSKASSVNSSASNSVSSKASNTSTNSSASSKDNTSISSSVSSASASVSNQSVSSSNASMSSNTGSLISNMNSRMNSMTPLATSLVRQKSQASNDYRVFQSYSNDAATESTAYNTNSNLAISYLNDTNSEKALASSENNNYLSAKNSSSVSSLGKLVLSDISAASNDANFAYSAASVATSNFDQEMSNISSANSEYLNMQSGIFNAPASAAASSASMSNSNSVNNKAKAKNNKAKNPKVKTLKVNLKLGSINGLNINLLNKNELEQLYFSELKDTNDVETNIKKLRDSHYYHNEELYDSTFDSNPTINTNNNTPSNKNNSSASNKSLLTLTSTPLVPKQDNFVPSDLGFNNGKSLPVPITKPLSGNNNNLIGQYANSEGTGGINATLYPNGTFYMTDGVEHTGYFSPATMKIGWRNINGTQSDNDNYISDNSDNINNSDNSDNSDTNDESDDTGAPYSKYNSDVVSEHFSDVHSVTGNMYAQFADQPQMRFFEINNSHFDGTYDYDNFFAGDNNLQSIQFKNTTGIEGGPNSSDANYISDINISDESDNSDNNWHLVDPSDWVDTRTGDTNGNDMINGDVWVNTKNLPIYHIFSIPVEAIIHHSNGSTTKQQKYASIKGLVGNSTIINLSQLNLPGYTNISSGNAAVAFNIKDNQFYYTNNGDTKNWTNINNIDPTLIVNFK